MTTAVFEAYIREMPRVRAIRALEAAEINMIPHISNFARKEWFRMMTRVLLPRFEGNKIVSFNGRVVTMGNLKKQLNKVAAKAKAALVG